MHNTRRHVQLSGLVLLIICLFHLIKIKEGCHMGISEPYGASVHVIQSGPT